MQLLTTARIIRECAGRRVGSLVDYLCPKCEKPPEPGRDIPQLELRPRFAFVPSAYGPSTAIIEATKAGVLGSVRETFDDGEYIERIEVVPAAYLRSREEFAGVEQVHMTDNPVTTLNDLEQRLAQTPELAQGRWSKAMVVAAPSAASGRPCSTTLAAGESAGADHFLGSHELWHPVAGLPIVASDLPTTCREHSSRTTRWAAHYPATGTRYRWWQSTSSATTHQAYTPKSSKH